MRLQTAALLGCFLLAIASSGCGDENSPPIVPLRILVTNDDGIAGAGMDAVVEALIADRRNLVVVSTPNGNRSGSGDATGPSERCGDLSVITTTTPSGYPATAVNGCPADATNYALDSLYPVDAPPQLVISGINEGQNVGFNIATRLSGTVGAAKVAAKRGVPALAASQGFPAIGGSYDYTTGVEAVLDWLEAHRSELEAGTAPATVENLNIPSCVAGTSIRGTVEDLPLATSSVGVVSPQDCASTLTNPRDDVEALLNGFISLSQVPLE